ncbi:MAG: hypothetical protein AAFW89_04880 [Bacteroidota bacterium]
MEASRILTEGMNNWKLRLILSALLCILGLGALVSMILGIFVHLSTYDKSIVGIAIFMVGVPAYLIVSGLAKVDQFTIAAFLNAHVDIVDGQAEVLIKSPRELSEEERIRREELEHYFEEHKLQNFLPAKPVMQAYLLFIVSIFGSFGVWFFAG